jgi:preprotein translocase subunit SecB
VAKDPHSVDAKAYNSLVGRATLRSIRLTSSRLDLRANALEVPSQHWKRRLNENIETFVDLEASRLYGMFVFEVVCRHGRQKMLTVSGTYLVSFSVDGHADEVAGQLFVERVGRVAVYPYFRSLVSGLITETGITLPPLPIISAAPRTIKSALDLEVKGAAKVLAGT